MANNADIIGEEAALRQVLVGDFSDTKGVFEDCDCVRIKYKGFYGKTLLNMANFPSLESAGDNTFENCYMLSSVDLGKISALPASMFKECHELRHLFIRNEDGVPSRGTNWHLNSPFYGNPQMCNLFVPRALIEDYKQEMFNSYPEIYKAIEDYTTDGTVTGEIDWSLIDTNETPILSVSNFTQNSSSPISTNIQLFNTVDPEFTILVDFTYVTNGSMSQYLCACRTGSGGSTGISIHRSQASTNVAYEYKRPGSNSTTNKAFTWGVGVRRQIAVVVKKQVVHAYVFDNGEFISESYGQGAVTSTIDNVFQYGQCNGVYHLLQVYDKALNLRQVLRVIGNPV